jgi:hypothetical protein
MTPECELECALQYEICLKCKNRKGCTFADIVIAFWEERRVKLFHKGLEENGLFELNKNEGE